MCATTNAPAPLADPSPDRAARAHAALDPAVREARSRELRWDRQKPGGASHVRALAALERAERDAAAAFAAARKPWEMTAAEWAAAMAELRADNGGAACTSRWHPRNVARVMFLRGYLPLRERRDAGGAVVGYTAPTHADVVAQAIADGCEVPADVLAEVRRCG
jgi:hypothetical protein